MNTKIIFTYLITLFFIFNNSYAQDDEFIKPYDKNPWYWQYKGKPLLLLGGSDDDNVFNWEDRLAVTDQLNLLASVGGNYDRCVLSSRDKERGNVNPYKLLDDGKYDLNQWNPEFWDRLEFYLRECAKRDIIVQIEIWATYDIGNRKSPFNPENNIQKDLRNAIFDYGDDSHRNRACFYNTIPSQANDKVALKYQHAFVDKLLSITLNMGNVLYCVDNEYHYESNVHLIDGNYYEENPSEWYLYWAKYIKDKAAEKGREVQVTEMNQIDWGSLLKRRAGEPLSEEDLERLGGQEWNPVLTKKHRALYDNSELFTFIDIGNNMGNSSPTEHWRHLQSIREYIKDDPHPLNNTKIYGNDYNSFWPTQEAVNKYWRNLIGGCASVRFHRPSAGQGLNELAQASIKSAKLLEKYVKPWECVPYQEAIADKGAHELYVLANVPEAYAVLIPHKVTSNDWLKLELEPGNTYDILWVNLNSGEWKKVTTQRSARWMALTPPDFVIGGAGLCIFSKVSATKN